MCTAVLSIEPGKPVLLAGVRDELTDRAWEQPAAHWPDFPGLIGGRDLQAGGTWLAVMASRPRVSCVLNGVGVMAPAAIRRSRGELPLLGAAGELAIPAMAGEPLTMAGHGPLRTQPAPPPAAPAGECARTGSSALPVRARDDKPAVQRALADYDPFHLIIAEPDRALLCTWDGVEQTERVLARGLHVIVNSGMASRSSQGQAGGGQTGGGQTGGGQARGVPPPDGREHELARITHFLGRFLAAARPDPRSGEPTREAWGAWFPLVNGDGIGVDDPRALIVRRDLGGGRTWGTTSISLVALSSGWLRYDFTAAPGDASSWREVL